MKTSLPLYLIPAFFLIGCSSTPKNDTDWFRDRDHDYRFAKEAERTRLPQGLAEERIRDLYPVPSLRNQDARFIDDLVMPPAQLVADDAKVTIQKLGDREWLLVRSSPSQLWPMLKAYVQSLELKVIRSNGRSGELDVQDGKNLRLFHLKQGFQHNTAELSVNAGISALGDVHQTLEGMGKYFADALDKPSYSYLARDISTEKAMEFVSDKKAGSALLLNVDHTRAVAAMQKALEKASFRNIRIIPENTGSVMLTTYHPVRGKKPGFMARLFGAKADDLDKSVPYAGHTYRIAVVSEKPRTQRVRLSRQGDGLVEAMTENREMLLHLQRYLR